MNLFALKENPGNPRYIKDERFEKLKKSIKEFPKMMKLRPIIYDPETNYILAGNMRHKALTALGYSQIPEDWVKSAEELTEEEKKRFIISDNLGFGEWDFDMLANEWELQDLEDWGMDFLPETNTNNNEDEPEAFIAVHKLEVTCDNENQLNTLFYELKDRGIKVKVKGLEK